MCILRSTQKKIQGVWTILTTFLPILVSKKKPYIEGLKDQLTWIQVRSSKKGDDFNPVERYISHCE